jgi:hypothetical protein
MKKLTFLGSKLALAAALLLAFTVAATANPLFSFSSVNQALVDFNGINNTFTFTDGVGGVDFSVTAQNSNWPGSVIGYTGDFEGTWTIANFGNPAAVTGTGTLTISNGSGATLVGDLVWDQIGTLGTGGTINVFGVLNFFNFVLTGTDANLQTLMDLGGARVVVTFQSFTGPDIQGDGGEDCTGLLGQIRCDASTQATFSGTLVGEQVPEPSTMLLSGAALLALGLLRKRIGTKA